MNLKSAILKIMTRDGLKAVVNDLEVIGADRCSRDDMHGHLSKNRHATPDYLLTYLYESEVKEVCKLLGIDSTGRKKALVQKLLDTASTSSIKNTDSPESEIRRNQPDVQATTQNRPSDQSVQMTSRKKKTEKKVTRYTNTERKERSGSCNFAAIDFETANHSRDSACAVGIAIVQADQIVSLKQYMIRPPTQEFCFTHIHGLTWNDVRDAPTFSQVWKNLLPVLARLNFLAAHNAPFDRSVLNACCESYRLRPPAQSFVCTVQIARSIWNIRPTKLPDVCRYLGISLTHHEAKSDAEACARIVLAAYKRGWQHTS